MFGRNMGDEKMSPDKKRFRILPNRTWFYPLLNILWPLGYKKCKSDELLFVTKSYKFIYCINNSGTMVWPIFNSSSKVSLNPIQVKIKLLHCLGKNDRRCHVNSVFNIGISTSPNVIEKFAERLLGLEEVSLNEMAQEVIEGQLRLAICQVIIEKITMEEKHFMNLLYENITGELQKLGLYLIEICELTLLDSESKNIIFNSTNVIYENSEHKPGKSEIFRAFGHRYEHKEKVIIDIITTNECYICKTIIQKPQIVCSGCRLKPLSSRDGDSSNTETSTNNTWVKLPWDFPKNRGVGASVHISDFSSLNQSSSQSKSDKMLSGWDKICENCGNVFEVKLRQKELGFKDSLKSISKMVKTINGPISTKDWVQGKKSDQHFCSYCLRRGAPSDWYCSRCKVTNDKCDCFDSKNCTECGVQVAKVDLHGTCCLRCYMEISWEASPGSDEL